MKYHQDLAILCLIITSISAMSISPHGGYLSIDEGTDFYLECIGNDPKWILAKRVTSETARISTQLLQGDRKTVLIIQGMDASLAGPYLCQTNQSVSTVILQLMKRKSELNKQIRFMATNTNQSVTYGNDVRLNCFAQYYSEKAMDSPYLPRILWFFERRQLNDNEDKYVLGTDSLVIRNFDYYDQGIYYCRAFITLKTNFLSKIYPILVQLQNSSSYTNDSSLSSMENKHCDSFTETILSTKTISYCNTDGEISNYTCPNDQIWDEDYSQCSSTINSNQTLQIIPNVASMPVELGRIYTFLCRSTDPRIEPEWTFENGTIITPSMFSIQQITSYVLSETHELYLRLAPVTPGTYICRSRPVVIPSSDDDETKIITTSITLKEQMVAEINGISFQSSTLPEYHLRTNATLFVACRPEYFDFQYRTNSSYIPIAKLIRVNDNYHFLFSEIADGLLIDRISKNESGMYLCLGQLPLSHRILTSIYPVLIFVSDPLYRRIESFSKSKTTHLHVDLLPIKRSCYMEIYSDESNNPYASRWSVTELKERQTNISVFARIYEEYTDAEHFFDFARKTASIIFQTKTASMIFAISLVLPVIMISVGISNLEECPLNRNIPVFVLVGGALALLKLLQVLWKQYNRHSGPSEEETTDTQNGSVFMDVLTTVFLIVWFIYGNHLIWHYRLPRFEQTTEDPENWCAKNVYLLTIISIAYMYAFVTLMILIVLIVVFTVHLHNRRRASREAKEVGCT